MSDQTVAPPDNRAVASARRWEDIYSRAKLASGLVLFTYLVLHLANHALGLVSLPAMEAGAALFKALWRSWPGTIALYTAAALHPLLALFNWIRRGHYRGIPWQGWTQLLLGLCIPVMLVDHAVGTRAVHSAFDLNDSYAFVLIAQFVESPMTGLRMNLLILIAWFHGCIGVYYWLRMKPLFDRCWPALFAIALLLPMLAMLGYLSGGRQVMQLLQDPEWRAGFRAGLNWPGDVAYSFAARANMIAYEVIAALLACGIALRGLIALLHSRRAGLTITYPDGRRYRGAAGSMSVLEASRAIGYPHASVCGGQGRCSTCRVRVTGPGAAALPPPDTAEQKVLERIMAPPGVRLACQIRPQDDIAVIPMLPAGVPPKVVYGAASHAQGSERRIAILFADLRGFTKLSESRLPYDVVFLLNQYFKAMGEAVDSAGGRLDKFIGDGVMALFGIEDGPDEGCRRALDAARRMGAGLARLNEALQADLGLELKIGIGIHCGPAIVGEMGHGGAMHLTAIGDAVNTASRLESATKEFGAELVVSEEVAMRGGLAEDAPGWQRADVSLRGKSETLAVRVARKAAVMEPAGALGD
ncbi:adenylate/guanylate cyclase domain-containing protein [Ferrovibrio sp.]|uniref:adenylate/guanylate cyclase domain-containing protein n=1 Tax=Ferrovibrio sp. TaxID=1917215 RepID=UPI0031201A14